MNETEAYGQAFQNGYKRGYEDGKRDAGMKQFEISCSRCGKRKRVRWDNFIKTTYEWKSGGGTLICPECAEDCKVITSRDKTIENMVFRMFAKSEPWKGD